MRHLLSPHITAFSTERGTVDAANPYSAFNVNAFYGDAPEHVHRCRQELCQRLGIGSRQLFIPRQVHGTKVLQIDSASSANDAAMLDGVDALITCAPGICLCVSTADCVPLFFHDARHEAIGIAHAGWRGTVQRIGARTLQQMHEAFGTEAADVACVIGPSIGPEAFEVGDEVYYAFASAAFPMQQIGIRRPATDDPNRQKWHIDLWQANAWQLTECDIRPEAIHTCGICTYTHHHRFFSARRLGLTSGRILNGIMKEEM